MVTSTRLYNIFDCLIQGCGIYCKACKEKHNVNYCPLQIQEEERVNMSKIRDKLYELNNKDLSFEEFMELINGN